MRKSIFTALLSAHVIFSYGQSNELRTLTKLDLGLQGVGLSFEPRLGKDLTTELAIGAGGGYSISEDAFEYNYSAPALYFSVTPKVYYNRGKRLAKNKAMSLNAGNYIGLRLKYTTRGVSESSNAYDALLMNIHWGIQRPLGKKWIINAHAGGGYAVDATDLSNSFGIIYPAVECKFSYIISKPK